jgi:hypothetical protein
MLPTAMPCTTPWKVASFRAARRDWLERQRTRPGVWYTTWAILYEWAAWNFERLSSLGTIGLDSCGNASTQQIS